MSPTGSQFVNNGISGNAINFVRNSTGYVNIGEVLPLSEGNFTFSLWIKSQPNDRTEDTIFLHKHIPNARGGYFMGMNDTGGMQIDNRAYLVIGRGTTPTQPTTLLETPISTTDVNDGEWHHIVATHDADSTKRIYVDGQLEGSRPSQAFDASSNPLVIGGWWTGSTFRGGYNGLIDEVQIYNRALGASEVQFLNNNPGMLAPLPTAPSITTQPADLVAALGQNAIFNVGASGTGEIAYQWFHGSQAMPGATNKSLILSTVTRQNAGRYSVVLANELGTITSQDAALRVLMPQSLHALEVLPQNGFRITFGDDNGGMLSQADISSFIIQYRVNLSPNSPWITVSNPVVLKNGQAETEVTVPAGTEQRFYRVITQ